MIRAHLLVALMREEGDSFVFSQASFDQPGDQGVMLFQRCLSVTSTAAQLVLLFLVIETILLVTVIVSKVLYPESLGKWNGLNIF